MVECHDTKAPTETLAINPSNEVSLHVQGTLTTSTCKAVAIDCDVQRIRAERRKLIYAVVTLTACCQLGVLSRYGTGKGRQRVFNDATALSPALPANILGSFLMGLLADGKALSPSLQQVVNAEHTTVESLRKSALPILPGVVSSAGLDALLLGVRTGFCGSLTTFSSWNQDMVELLVGGDWREAFAGYMIGLMLPLGALAIGRMAALYLYLIQTRGVPTTGSGSGYCPASPSKSQWRLVQKSEKLPTRCGLLEVPHVSVTA